MLGSLTNKLQNFSKVAGIELLLSSSGTTYAVVVLERKKDILSIVEKQIGYTTIDQIIKLLGKDVPIVLSIDGKGVMHKKISSANTNQLQQLNQVLPNASPDDFYLQITSSKESPIASIIRFDQLSKIIDDFNNMELSIVELALGPFYLRYLAETISINQYSSSSGTLNFTSNSIENWDASINENPSSFKLGDEQIDSQLTLATANAFKGIVLPELLKNEQPTIVKEARNEFLNKRLFHKLGFGFLLGFLGVLLFNFILFQHFFTNNTKLKSQLFVQRSQLIELDTLKSQHKSQQKLFNQYNLTKQSKVSFYSDRLATGMPNSIQLEELQLFPVLNSKNRIKGKAYLFMQNRLLASGNAKSCLAVNEWSQKLNTLNWVNDARILHCGVNDAEVLVFEMEIEVE